MKFSASVASMFFLLSAVLAHGAGTADGYREECEKELAEAKTIFHSLEKLEGPKTIETVLVPLNELEVILSKQPARPPCSTMCILRRRFATLPRTSRWC